MFQGIGTLVAWKGEKLGFDPSRSRMHNCW